MWNIPSIWQGGECWIIGGGHSVLEQFGIPSQLICPQTELGALASYFQPLHNFHVIGVNSAFLLGDWISVCLFGDRTFFADRKKQLAQFKNLKIRTASLSIYDKEWYRDIKFVDYDLGGEGLSREGRLIYNRSTGGMAVDLAVKFGVKKIYLLGYDMKGKGGETHWHNNYGEKRTTEEAFHKFLKPWEAMARDADALGVEIVNVSPDSLITVFKKQSLQEVLDEKEVSLVG